MASLKSFPLCELVQWDYHPRGDSPYTAVGGFRGGEPTSQAVCDKVLEFFLPLSLVFSHKAASEHSDIPDVWQ